MKLRLAAAAALAGIALAPIGGRNARAVTTQLTPPALSGYDLRGRAGGVVVSYDIPGRLPISPVVDVAIPDVQSAVSAGPTSSASSSLAHPGPLILGLNTVYAQAAGAESPLPPYPVIVRAPNSEGTSAEDRTTVPGGTMAARAEGASSAATASMPGRATPVVASVGTVEATSSTVISGSVATTHVRVEVDGLDLLGGLVRIDGLITDLKVTTNGVTAKTSGGTTFAGVEALGVPAVIDAGGIRFAQGSGAPLPALPLDSLLKQAGISIRAAQPLKEVRGPAGSIRTSGLSIDFSGELQATPLGQLFGLIPPLPELDGSPFQAADLIAIVGANHVSGLAIGGATATSSARPVLSSALADALSPPLPAIAAPGGATTDAAPLGTAPGSTLGTPASVATDAVRTSTNRTTPRLPLADVVGWRLVALAVAAAFLASLWTRKLPDIALAATDAHACGLDPPADRSST